MAERMMPEYQQALEVMALPLEPWNAMAKLHAASMVAEWKAWLFPADDEVA